MRIFKILSFVIILIMTLQCKNSEQKLNTENTLTKSRLDSLFFKYKVEKIYLGAFFTNKLFNKKYSSLEGQNQDSYYCSLESDLIEYFSHNSNQLDSIKRCLSQKDIIAIDKWCLIDQRLNSIPIKSDEGVTFEEIIYNMEDGKQFYQNFIKHENQYYGSLDFEQSCHLYYNVISYLMDCDEREFDVFFKEYFERYKSLNADK